MNSTKYKKGDQYIINEKLITGSQILLVRMR